MDKSLKQIEAECAHWQVLSFGLIGASDTVKAVYHCAQANGWGDTRDAAMALLTAIANLLEGEIIPAVDRHHEEHKAAQLETSRLEAGYL